MFATTGLSFFLLSIYLSAFLSLFIIEVKYVFVAPSDTLRMLDVARLEAVAARTFAPEMVLIWSSLLPVSRRRTTFLFPSFTVHRKANNQRCHRHMARLGLVYQPTLDPCRPYRSPASVLR